MRWLLALLLVTGCATQGSAGSPATGVHGRAGSEATRQPSGPSSLFVLPNRRLTPGAVATHSLAVICRTPTSSRRQVSDATKAQVYARYGLPVEHGAWEIDHLIPLELGGAVNDPRNLWAEPGATPGGHGSYDKDTVENHLNALVCNGKTTLAAAQHTMATDWRKGTP